MLAALRIVVIGHHFLKYVEIAGLLDVCRGGKYQPQRVVVEIAADLVVALLGERLVLVVRTTVFSCVAARSSILSLALCGIWWTNPRMSWLESLKPMPCRCRTRSTTRSWTC